MYNGGTSQTTITNSTIAANNEGIRDISSSPLRLNNSIVARNPDCASCDSVDIFVDTVEVPAATIDPASSNNLIGVDGGVVGISNGVNGNQIGTGEAPVNPLLGPLANNGGPTLTHALNNFSPAIDAGSNALAVDQNNAALTTDQRGAGFPRIDHSVVDIGAYETIFVEPPPNADLGVTKFAGREESLADRDIVYTITVTNSGPDAAENATLNDVLPGDLTFVSMPTPAGWTCMTPSIGSGGTVDCTHPSLAVGSVTTFTLTVHIPVSPSDTEYHNVATVLANTVDLNSANDSASANVTIVSCLTNPIVTSNANSGVGSLRQAIIDACDGSTITFNMDQVVSPITLTTGELIVDKNLTITGPGANLLTVSGNLASRVFNIGTSVTAVISGLTVANGKVINSAAGGGIYIDTGGTLTLTDSTLSGNSSSGGSASSGGGIANLGTLTIANSTLSGNSANGGSFGNSGGGIFNNTGATLTIINSTLSGNSASGGPGGNGGAIQNSGTLTITNSTLSGNSADSGGAILNTGTASVTNSTLSGNFASSFGGGITSGGGSTTLTITNSTLSGNSVSGGSGQGGGIFNGGTANLRSTIIAQNTATSGPDFQGTLTSQGHRPDRRHERRNDYGRDHRQHPQPESAARPAPEQRRTDADSCAASGQSRD